MGKATMISDRLKAHPLLPAEMEARVAERAIGGANVRATLDGTLVEDTAESASPRAWVQADREPWD